MSYKRSRDVHSHSHSPQGTQTNLVTDPTHRRTRASDQVTTPGATQEPTHLYPRINSPVHTITRGDAGRLCSSRLLSRSLPVAPTPVGLARAAILLNFWKFISQSRRSPAPKDVRRPSFGFVRKKGLTRVNLLGAVIGCRKFGRVFDLSIAVHQN